MQTRGDTGEQITAIAKQLSYVGYLSYDAIVWANAVKFIKLDQMTIARVNRIANRFWLSGIMFSIVHSLIKAGRLAIEAKKLRSAAWNDKDVGAAVDRDRKSQAIEITRATTRHQFIIDALDVWFPASGLGFVNVNDGVLGIFGFITSFMALQAQWKSLNGKK